VKRSSHVALLLMGTLAVGGGPAAFIPRANCEPSQPNMATPPAVQAGSGSVNRGGFGSFARALSVHFSGG
jgi:hypothetical protein